MKSFETGSVLKEGDYNQKVKGLPVWHMALILCCVLAVLFFVLTLAN
jgi:type VI protein secretion system component VasF